MWPTQNAKYEIYAKYFKNLNKQSSDVVFKGLLITVSSYLVVAGLLVWTQLGRVGN